MPSLRRSTAALDNPNSPAMIDFLAGQTQVDMANLVTALPQMRAGKIRGLAVSSSKRSAAAPELPTLDESGLKGFAEGGQHGIVAPAGIPKDILTKLHGAIVAAMRAPEVANHLANEGSAVVANSPDEFRALIRRETTKWQRIVAAAGIKPQ